MRTKFFVFFALLIAMSLLALGLSRSFVEPRPQEEVIQVRKTSATTSRAIIANGCFWCVEADFEKVPGVTDVRSGFSGGFGGDPTYSTYGESGHREVVEILYDPSILSYKKIVLLTLFGGNPTDSLGSFVDRGREYAPAIFFATDKEKAEAQAVIRLVDEQKIYDRPLTIEVLPQGIFYEAEQYHQDFYRNNILRYTHYRNASGRDDFIAKHWGGGEKFSRIEKKLATLTLMTKTSWKDFTKKSDEELRQMLTPMQYTVTQKGGTEKPFDNAYHDHKEKGIYVDVVSGEPLFLSTDKYDSGTGWPSFVKPIAKDAVTLHEDKKLFVTRTEVRSKIADSHLGHVFADGPKDRGGMRYCMNSAALTFIPFESMEAQGYEDYIPMFP